VRPHLSVTRGKWKSAKPKNYDIDALKIRSMNNCGSLLKCPTITALVATFNAKAFNDTESCNACLAAGKTYSFDKRTKLKRHG